MNWEQIVQKIADFWNMPVPIIGFTVGTLIIGALAILSKTSIGKKAINWCKIQLEAMKKANEEVKKEYEEIIKTKDEIIAKLTQEYEEKLAIVEYNRDLERNTIINALSCINNIKVKKIVEEFKNTIQPATISEVVENIEKQYESKFAELLARVEELENEKGKNSDTEKEAI